MYCYVYVFLMYTYKENFYALDNLFILNYEDFLRVDKICLKFSAAELSTGQRKGHEIEVDNDRLDIMY